MKEESLVIADQLCRGEYVLELCTHRPSRQGSREYPKRGLYRTTVSSVTGTKLIMASYVGNRIVKSN